MIFDFLFDKEEISYPINLPGDTAVETLAEHVSSPGQSTSVGGGLVGSVKQDNVFLYAAVSKRDSFVQTFYGRFIDDPPNTALVGEITLNRMVRKFMLLWIIIVGLVWIATVFSLFINPAASWSSLMYVTVMLMGAVGFLLYVKNKSKSANKLLKDYISTAFQDNNIKARNT